MSEWFRETAESKRLLAEELALVDAAELVTEALERREVSRTSLAKTLGVRLSEISQRLSGKRNLTLRNLAAMLHELDFDLELDARDRGTGQRVAPKPAVDWKDAEPWASVDLASIYVAAAGHGQMAAQIVASLVGSKSSSSAGRSIEVDLPGIAKDFDHWVAHEPRVQVDEIAV